MKRPNNSIVVKNDQGQKKPVCSPHRASGLKQCSLGRALGDSVERARDEDMSPAGSNEPSPDTVSWGAQGAVHGMGVIP